MDQDLENFSPRFHRLSDPLFKSTSGLTWRSVGFQVRVWRRFRYLNNPRRGAKFMKQKDKGNENNRVRFPLFFNQYPRPAITEKTDCPANKTAYSGCVESAILYAN